MICVDLYRDRFECDGIIVHCAVWCDMIPDCDDGFDEAHCLPPVRDTEPPKPDDCEGDGKLFIQANCVICTARLRSCGKVMFSQVCVTGLSTPPSGHMGYDQQAGGTHPTGMLSHYVCLHPGFEWYPRNGSIATRHLICVQKYAMRM